MPNSRELEQQIEKVERLKVRLIHENGRQVRTDSDGFSDYPFQKAANGNLTIAAWKQTRICKHFEGYDIEVLSEDGSTIHARTLLANARGVATSKPQIAQSVQQDDAVIVSEPTVRAEIQYPKLVHNSGGPFPSIEVDTDHLPYVGAFEDAVHSAAKAWMGKKNMSSSATIWKWGTPSCNFIEHGMVWSVYVVPFGFGPKFLEFLYNQLSAKLQCVRYGEYVSPNEDDGWRAVCHIQGGKVYQAEDAVCWSEVL